MVRRAPTAQAWLLVTGLLFVLVAGCSFELPSEIPCESNLNCPYSAYCSIAGSSCPSTAGVCLPLPESCVADFQCPIHHLCIEDESTGLATCKRTLDPTAPGNQPAIAGSSTEESCDDNQDNDCDGQVDCEDEDCSGTDLCGDDDDDTSDPLQVNCTNFCLLYQETCLPDGDPSRWDPDQCHEGCQTMLDWAGLEVGQPGTLEGNTLSCRMGWLGPDGESTGEPLDARCSFGGLLGGRSSIGYPCADRNPEERLKLSWPYCVLGAGSCAIMEQEGGDETGWLGLFSDFQECLDVAGGLPRAEQDPPPGTDVGNSLECRLGRLELAIFEQDVADEDRPALCGQGLPESNYCTDPNSWSVYEGPVTDVNGITLPWVQAMDLIGDTLGQGAPHIYDVTSIPFGLQVWAVGEGGLIVHSNDGGQSWTVQGTPTVTGTLYGIDMLPSGHGWAVGAPGPDSDSIILHTENWGHDWSRQSTETNDPTFYDVVASSSNYAVVYGGQGSANIYVTIDGGGSWTSLPIVGGAGVLKSACRYQDEDIVRARAVGNGGTVMYSLDGAPTLESFPDPDVGLWGIGCNTYGSMVIAVGSSQQVFHAVSPGSWSQGDIGVAGSSGTVYDVHVHEGAPGNFDSPVAWAVGGNAAGGFISYTAVSDPSEPWQQQSIPSSPVLRGITCMDPDSCWAVGEDGLMMSTGLDSLPETDLDGDGFAAQDDCDDSNPAVNPGAQEICDDLIDNDCDGFIDPDGCEHSGDDDDGAGDDDDDASLPAEVVCDDGLDNDNDGWADCNDQDCITWPHCNTCSAYCAARQSHCSPAAALCASDCGNALLDGLMSAGTPGATSGGSLACRIYHTVGSTNADHCDHGNRFGGSVASGFACSDTLVEPYCSLAQAYCDGDNQLFTTLASCTGAAQLYDFDGTLGSTSGNTIQCRLYHLEVAAISDPEIHCPHASPGGGGVCSSSAR